MSWAILNQKSKMIYLEGMSIVSQEYGAKKSNLIYHHHPLFKNDVAVGTFKRLFPKAQKKIS